MALSDWKALCVSEIIEGRIFLSLFARTFETSLYKTLHKAIGRNSMTCSGFLTLGIRSSKFGLSQEGKNHFGDSKAQP